jgi:2',3'-cyclic-nucleotide 2'-phosphodiesterase (5'-nucleotidase family)
MEKIIFLHTNDLHSHFENWPKTRRFLMQRKVDCETRQHPVVTVDLGDFIDRWHPLTEATNGRANIELMNTIGFDAVTIGNNEGVGNAKKDLDALYTDANFPIVLDNLFDKKTLAQPSWSTPYKIITTKTGTKIGLMGYTAPFPLTYSPNGWDIRDPFDLLPAMIDTLRPQVDVLVLMSHLGIGDERRAAQSFPEIDVILGSHTHHLFEHGEMQNGVLLAAAGKHGQYVGEVQVVLDDSRQIISKTAKTYATSAMLEIAEDQSEIAGYLAKGHQLLQAQVVAEIPYDLDQQISGAHPFIKTALEAVKERANSSAAILSSGLFLADIKAGLVNQDELHTSLPHPMHLIKVTLPGKEIKRLILEMERNRNFLRHYHQIGMGFRGKIFGEICYSGIEFDAINRRVTIEGQAPNDEQLYTFVTVDHFLFIPFFPTIELMGDIEFIFPEFIRSVVGEYLATHYPIS